MSEIGGCWMLKAMHSPFTHNNMIRIEIEYESTGHRSHSHSKNYMKQQLERYNVAWKQEKLTQETGRHQISAAVTHTENSRNFALLYLPADCRVCGNSGSRRKIAMWKIRKIQPILCHAKRLCDRAAWLGQERIRWTTEERKTAEKNPRRGNRKLQFFPLILCIRTRLLLLFSLHFTDKK